MAASAAADDPCMGKTYTIGFSHSVSEAIVVKAVRNYADQRAAELGCVTVLQGNVTANNLEQQTAEVTGWINQGVDAIVMLPIDTAATQKIIEQAHEKGIKVLTYAFPVDGADGLTGFDATISGKACGDAAAAFIKENFPDGGAEALVGTLTAMPLLEPRWAEAIKAIEAAGGKVVAQQDGATIDVGQQVTETTLQAYPDLSIVVGLNDDFAVGASKAFEKAGKDPAKSFICGQDGSLEGLAAIKEGKWYKGSAAILIDQLGASIVDMSMNAVNGKPSTVMVPAEYISLAQEDKLDGLIAAYDALK